VLQVVQDTEHIAPWAADVNIASFVGRLFAPVGLACAPRVSKGGLQNHTQHGLLG
jgi:hypothetical protein